ncbi:MAG: thermonuclease family protein [Cellulosilyticaceae bacterium]
MLQDTYYRYATVTRVIDGDTFEARVDLGFYITITERFRIKGMNAPEIKGPERLDGLTSKAYLEALIMGQPITICSTKQDGFRRYLADVYVVINGVEESVAQIMIDKGYAKKMDYK